LKEELGLSIDVREIKILLQNMVKADLIREGNTDNRYQGLTDGTLCLILQNRFEEEIAAYQPDLPRSDLKRNFHEEIRRLKSEKKSLQGMVNHLSGMMAEYQLTCEFRSKKRFSLSRYFAGVKDDAEWNIQDVRMRVKFQRPDGKEMELDVLAESDGGRTLVVEVKKTKEPTGVSLIRDFLEKVKAFSALNPENQVVPAFFSVGGFTEEARRYCEAQEIPVAVCLELFQAE
jgi:hypothetical protein